MDMNDRFSKIPFTSITPQTPAASAPESKGRNGQIKTTGVEVYANDQDKLVQLSPITSRGDVSQASYLQIPFDKQTLTALAARFTHLAELAPDTPQA